MQQGATLLATGQYYMIAYTAYNVKAMINHYTQKTILNKALVSYNYNFYKLTISF